MSASMYLLETLAERPEGTRLPSRTGSIEAVHVFDLPMIDAINASQASGRPLLVRGEPGVGKSQLARAAAKELQRPFISYTVTIQTEAQDLLWHYDSIRRLADAQISGTRCHASQNAEYRQKEDEAEKADELDVHKYIQPGPLWWAFHWKSAETQAKHSQGDVRISEDGTDTRNGCVLLIDEIDKAEADVPNGLLEALGAGQFSVFAKSEAIVAQHPRPLVIITTNEERTLPDAFLRRCMVLDMKLPELPEKRDQLIALLMDRGLQHFPDLSEDIRKEAAVQLCADRQAAQDKARRPLPGQAEYLDILRVLHNYCSGDETKQNKYLKRIGRFALQKHDKS